jgi:hypothetical protein
MASFPLHGDLVGFLKCCKESLSSSPAAQRAKSASSLATIGAGRKPTFLRSLE